MRVVEAIRSRLRSEAGFGLVEVLTASILLAVGLVGALGAFDAAGKLTHTAQRHEQAISLAQQEMETLKAIAFEELLLDAAPAAQPADDPNNPSDPRAYVVSGNFRILRNYHDAAAGPPPGVSDAGEPLLVDANTADDGASIPSTTAGVAAGDTTATVYRFITRRDENCTLDGTTTDLCPDEEVSRRITVAVRLDQAGNGAGPHKPVYVSSVVTDPNADPLEAGVLP